MPPERRGDSPVDSLVQQLQERVAQRRAEGFYPPGMEQQLDAHFRRITTFRQQTGGTLRDRIEAIGDTVGTGTATPTTSRIPGGAFVHKIVGRLVDRHVQRLRAQVDAQAIAVQAALDTMVEPIESQMSEREPGTARRMDDVEARHSELERALNAVRADLLTVIDRRVGERAQPETVVHGFSPWYGNDEFEALFRGSRKELVDRYRDLAAHFDGCSPVLDIGFGRGELLELLGELGVRAFGVEMDGELVKEVAELGFDVREDDGLSFLAGLDDGSLGGVAMIQVVEHLTPQDVVDVVALAHRKLRPGGKAIVETVNPQSLYVFAHSFYIDPTHVRPVHPGYLAFLFREAGFSEVAIDWRNPPDHDLLRALPGDDDATRALNENIERLNTLLYAPQDFAIVATR